MKQLLILSGKGGTGKTTLASAFVKLSGAKAFADCDVDAPNLHLVIKQSSPGKRTDYYGMPKAVIDQSLCIGCGLCRKFCRFEAIELDDGTYKVDGYGCEGCSVCKEICPTEAISLQPSLAGELMLYIDDHVFSTAQLKMGSGTSGKLVTEVKNQLKTVPVDGDLAIIDGSPGIGCPVIASLAGVDLVLIVAEPSLSGISDMERIISTAQKFQILTVVCVNKYDVNLENTKKIAFLCEERGIPFVGTIPFDPKAVIAINNGQTVIDLDCRAGRACEQVFQNTLQILYA